MRLPTGWAEASIGELTVDRVEQRDPGASPVEYIDIGSIDRDLKRVGATDKVTKVNAPTRARQWVRTGDVLVSLTRPNLNAVAMVPPELDGAVASTGFDVLRALDVLPEWLFNRVRSQRFVSDVCEGVQGVVYPAIRPADVRRHTLPIPPLLEQRRIIDAVDSYLTRLDDAVASLERAQAKLKAYRASVLKAAIEGRLVPTEAALARAEKRDYEPADVLLTRILKERRRRWEEAELVRLRTAGRAPKDDKWKVRYEGPKAPRISELRELPEGWCWASTDQLAAPEDYSLAIGPFGSNLKVDDYRASGVPLVFVRNIRSAEFADDDRARFVSVKKSEELRPHWVQPGDILVTKMGDPPGDCCLYPRSRPTAVITADCIKLTPAVDISGDYLVLAITSDMVRLQIISATRGVAQKKVSLERFRPLAIPIPPRAEQVRLVEACDLLLTTAEASQGIVDANMARINRLRQAVLKWAFDGKLVDQDPNDESAEKLVARIRAERAAAAPQKEAIARRRKGAA